MSLHNSTEHHITVHNVSYSDWEHCSGTNVLKQLYTLFVRWENLNGNCRGKNAIMQRFVYARIVLY